MNSKNSFTTIAPPVFDGTNYQVWVVRMEAYLDANTCEKLLNKCMKFHPCQTIQLLHKSKTKRRGNRENQK
ncbi:hypothetical protein LguiA_004812 [Lonicera macranthoides]